MSATPLTQTRHGRRTGRPGGPRRLATVAIAVAASWMVCGPALAAPPTAPRAGVDPAAVVASTADRESAQGLFELGVDQYADGAYAQAAETWSAVLTRFDIKDPVIYYNLGNAHFRDGAFGAAILHYRRGLRLSPSGEVAANLSANLNTSRRVLQERYRAGSDTSQFIYADPSSVLYRATHLIGELPLAIAFAVAWFALWGLLILKRRRGQRPGRWAIPLFIVLLLLGGVLLGQRASDADYRVGVVVSDGVRLRDARNAEARGIDIPEGIEVRFVKQVPDWTQVELPSGRRGWLKAASVEQI